MDKAIDVTTEIGGGSLAAGGGGIAVGQAVLNGINVVTTAGGITYGSNKKK
ncbi:hypothetical protein [Clostridium sp.]